MYHMITKNERTCLIGNVIGLTRTVFIQFCTGAIFVNPLFNEYEITWGTFPLRISSAE